MLLFQIWFCISLAYFKSSVSHINARLLGIDGDLRGHSRKQIVIGHHIIAVFDTHSLLEQIHVAHLSWCLLVGLNGICRVAIVDWAIWLFQRRLGALSTSGWICNRHGFSVFLKNVDRWPNQAKVFIFVLVWLLARSFPFLKRPYLLDLILHTTCYFWASGGPLASDIIKIFVDPLAISRWLMNNLDESSNTLFLNLWNLVSGILSGLENSLRADIDESFECLLVLYIVWVFMIQLRIDLRVLGV
jgi:hypothetical protein